MELCRKFLGKLCTIQNEEIVNNGGSPLFNKNDFLEIINHWSMIDCTTIVCRICIDVLDAVSSNLEINDEMVMPWCTLNGNDCDRCKYGQRHGQCSDPDSDYRKELGTTNVSTFSRGKTRERVLELIQNYHELGVTTKPTSEVPKDIPS